jgi:hypothetical protein
VGEGTAKELVSQGYLLPLARMPRVLAFVKQPGNLDRLRRIVSSANAGGVAGPSVDVVVSSLDLLLQKNPGLTAAEIETAAIKARSPMVKGGSATWVDSPGSSATFRINPDGSVTITGLYRGEIPKGTGGTMLASALRAAGASKPTKVILYDVVNEPTFAALKQDLPFADTVLGKTVADTAAELGGRVVDTKVTKSLTGVTRSRGRTAVSRAPVGQFRYDVTVTIEY